MELWNGVQGLIDGFLFTVNGAFGRYFFDIKHRLLPDFSEFSAKSKSDVGVTISILLRSRRVSIR